MYTDACVNVESHGLTHGEVQLPSFVRPSDCREHMLSDRETVGASDELEQYRGIKGGVHSHIRRYVLDNKALSSRHNDVWRLTVLE